MEVFVYFLQLLRTFRPIRVGLEEADRLFERNRGAGELEHICRMTAFCIDKPADLAARPQLGPIWKRRMGHHFPALSMIFVADLLDRPGLIELEATAVLPAA